MPDSHPDFQRLLWQLSLLNQLVGAGRFERPTPCAQGRCATRLRYAPTFYIFDSKLLLRAMQRPLTSTVANRDKTPGRAQNRVKIQDSAISVSYDRRHRKADSSKQNLVGPLEFCAGLTGAKLMIPLVVDHLMSTCFSRRSRPGGPGRPRVPPTSRLALAGSGPALI
jgi:hypothetical protein